MNKKAYTKPELFCEEYELSTSIAANCTWVLHRAYTTATERGQCGYKMGTDTLFMEAPICNITPDFDGDDVGFGSVCYQVPTDGALAFSS